MSFPVSPVDQQIAIVNGIKYIFTAATRSWARVPLKNYVAAASAPASPANGDHWYNTTTDILYEYISDFTSNYWVDIVSMGATGNLTLVNLEDTALAGNITPTVTNRYSIGTAGGTLANVYVSNVVAGYGAGNAIVVSGNIVPSANVTYNLGTTTNRFKDLYLSGSTIYLGGAIITTDGANVTISNPSGGSLNISGTSSGSSDSAFKTVSISGTTTSTNTTTGALTVAGGAGIAGTTNVGGNLNVLSYTNITGITNIGGNVNASSSLNVTQNAAVTGDVSTSRVYFSTGLFWSGNGASAVSGAVGGSNRQVQYNATGGFAGASTLTYDSASGNVVVGSGATSTSTTTGALVVAGGVGIGGTVTVGGTLSVTGVTTVTSNIVAASGSASTSNITGALTVLGGIGSTGNIFVTGNAILGSSTTSNVVIAATTVSTSATTGALVVSGGAGFSANIVVAGYILPSANATYDLGSSTLRWRNIYTNDLQLSNGIGDYTVVEGEEDLFLYNNRTGKTYKFLIQEVDPSTVPPKARQD
jgi:hypothetical protein